MNTDPNIYYEKIKRIADSSKQEWGAFELYSKSRDEYAKLLINYLFLLNSSSIVAMPILMKLDDKYSFSINDIFQSFKFFAIGLIFCFLCTLCAWINIFCLSTCEQIKFNIKLNNITMSEFKEQEKIIEDCRISNKINKKSLEKINNWINPMLFFSILCGIVSLFNLISGWINIISVFNNLNK